MSVINPATTREQLAAIVVKRLRQHGIEVVLVGGSVVSIYTENKYESNDLDFISPAGHQKITAAMLELGFTAKGKDFIHQHTKFTVEFPGEQLRLGDDEPVIPEGKIRVDDVDIVLLSPTQSVMDRLASFFYWHDRQCLDQAVWISDKHPVNFDQVRGWAKREGQAEKLKVFLSRLRLFKL